MAAILGGITLLRYLASSFGVSIHNIVFSDLKYLHISDSSQEGSLVTLLELHEADQSWLNDSQLQVHYSACKVSSKGEIEETAFQR